MRAFAVSLVIGAVVGLVPSSAPSATGAEPAGRIVFSSRFWPKDSRVVDNWELFVQRLGGGDAARLRPHPRCSDVWPSWSHSGRWIAFGCGWGPSAGLYVIGRDGGGRRSVLRLPNRRVEGTAWSPDDRRIAFGAGGIWVVDGDGGNRRRLTRAGSMPSWSADGRSIAHERDGDVFIMRSDGTGRRRLVSAASNPAWSPDGRRIVFLRPSEIWIINADGRGLRQLRCCRPRGVAAVAWSPDSRHLVYDGGDGIFVMPVDGTTRRRVSGGLEVLGLAWGP